MLEASTNDLRPARTKDNWKGLPKITAEADDDTSKWDSAAIEDISQRAIDGPEDLTLDHNGLVPKD